MDQVGYVTVLILQLDTRRCWSNLNSTANQQQSWDQPLCTVWVGLQSFPPAPLECSVALWLGLHLPSTHVAWTNSRQAQLCLLFFTTYWAWPSLFFFQTAGCGIHKPEESRRERRKAKYLDIQGKCWSSLLVENLFIDALHWPTGSRLHPPVSTPGPVADHWPGIGMRIHLPVQSPKPFCCAFWSMSFSSWLLSNSFSQVFSLTSSHLASCSSSLIPSYSSFCPSPSFCCSSPPALCVLHF